MVKMYEVGGMLRDQMLNLPIKDFDYAIEAESFEAMRRHLLAEGFTIFLETPEYLTIRARFPKPTATKDKFRSITADFVLCRKDGSYSDGRRPDEVTPGTILDDLARRDFTVNAMARDMETGEVIDPHDGMLDLEHRVLQCVGDTEARLREDSLRALRAIRFVVTKDLEFEDTLLEALNSDWLPPLLANVSTDRKWGELHQTFMADTMGAMSVFEHDVSPLLKYAAFFDKPGRKHIRLKPTLED